MFVLVQQDKSKCRPGAAGWIEMSSQRIGGNIVLEQQARSNSRLRGRQIRAERHRSPEARTIDKLIDNKYIYIYI